MTARAIYDIILVNLTKDHKHWWNSNIRESTAQYLKNWFQDCRTHSPDYKNSTVRCWWRHNKLLVEEDELVVYFLAEKNHSIISKKGGPLPQHNEGGTWMHGKGMISEVYIGAIAINDATRLAKSLAVVAFHELMHNKLDADNNPIIKNPDGIHTYFKGKDQSVSKPKVGHNDVPTSSEKMKLGENLAHPVKQYTDAMLWDRKKII